MISSAEEFIGLVESSVAVDNSRAVIEEASDEVWLDVANKYPDYEEYVIQNNTISLEVMGFCPAARIATRDIVSQ